MIRPRGRYLVSVLVDVEAARNRDKNRRSTMSEGVMPARASATSASPAIPTG